jgi:hypothetical protein
MLRSSSRSRCEHEFKRRSPAESCGHAGHSRCANCQTGRHTRHRSVRRAIRRSGHRALGRASRRASRRLRCTARRPGHHAGQDARRIARVGLNRGRTPRLATRRDCCRSPARLTGRGASGYPRAARGPRTHRRTPICCGRREATHLQSNRRTLRPSPGVRRCRETRFEKAVRTRKGVSVADVQRGDAC